jgi:hypothetical protein
MWVIDHLYFGGEYVGYYSTNFVFKDMLGSTRILTDVNKAVKDSLDYLPFGEQQTGGALTSLKFTGKERDSESGLDNFGARYNSSQWVGSCPQIQAAIPRWRIPRLGTSMLTR